MAQIDKYEPNFKKRDKITAGLLNALVEAAKRGVAGPNSFVDATGVYNRPAPKADAEDQGDVMFKLKDPLPLSGSVAWVKAYRGEFDASANSGKGGYTYSTAVDNEFWVADLRRLGFSGAAGAVGACKIRTADNGEVGEIVDMECLS